jgi:RNA-binding protein Musashi
VCVVLFCSVLSSQAIDLREGFVLPTRRRRRRSRRGLASFDFGSLCFLSFCFFLINFLVRFLILWLKNHPEGFVSLVPLEELGVLLFVLHTVVVLHPVEIAGMDSDQGKLFIGGISWETTEEKLRDYFKAYGEVTETVIMKDRATGRARGFGFVIFADPSVADRVVNEKHTIDGRTVSLSYLRRRFLGL